MVFTGLPLATLLPLAGVAAAIVVFFYVLKLRRRPVAVPFARIWERILRDQEATHLFSQLKRLLSLLLQLVLLTLLLMALGDPRLAQTLLEGRSTVVLVDTSASMKALDVAPSRLGAAREEVRRLVGSLANADRVLVARMDATVAPLSTMTDDTAALEAAVDALAPTDTRADLAQGLAFALDVLRGLPHPEIVVVGDGAYGDLAAVNAQVALGDMPVRFIPLGKEQRNVAITQFSVRRYPLDKSRHEALLEVTNTNDVPADVELTLLGDGDVVDVTRLKLGPRERLPRFYADLAGANRTIEARITLTGGDRDYLPADDHAYALMPERRRARVLVVTSGNTYLEAALLLDEYLDVTLIEPARYPPPGAFDVTIFDGVAPALAAGTGAALYLDPPAEGGPVVPDRAVDELFGFDEWDRKSPLVRWMAMADIQVASGHTLHPGPGDRVVGASEHGPILVSGTRGGRPFVALGFDPRRSDLVLRVAWPLFILNTIDHFVQEDASYISSFRTGDVWRIPTPSSASLAELRDPSGRTRSVPVQHGRAVHFGDQAGFYELVVPGEPEAAKIGFAGNLVDLAESEIAPRTELGLGAPPPAARTALSPGIRRDIWVYLVAAVLLLSAIEWFTFHRRVTV